MTKYRFTKQVITSEVIETDLPDESDNWDEYEIFDELDERLANDLDVLPETSYEYIVEVLEPDGWNTKLKSTDKEELDKCKHCGGIIEDTCGCEL